MSILNLVPKVASILNETTAIPQLFNLQTNGSDVSLHAYVAGTPGSGDTPINGAVVFNKENPATLAYSGLMPRTDETSKNQTILLGINSANRAPSLQALTFRSSESLGLSGRPGQLVLHVHAPRGDDHVFVDGDGNYSLIPLLTSPGAISLAPVLDQTEIEQTSLKIVQETDQSLSLGFSLGSIGKAIVKSVPVIASAGYQIYKEVSSDSSDEKVASFLPIGAIASAAASVAIPLAGSVIKNLLSD
ncbi:MAG: hypothetical protein AAFP89_20470 [Bacteroidota bacterium]